MKFINISDVYANHLELERLGLINGTIPECALYGLTPSDILIDRSSVKLEGVGYSTVFPECDEVVVFCPKKNASLKTIENLQRGGDKKLNPHHTLIRMPLAIFSMCDTQ